MYNINKEGDRRVAPDLVTKVTAYGIERERGYFLLLLKKFRARSSTVTTSHKSMNSCINSERVMYISSPLRKITARFHKNSESGYFFAVG